MNLRDYTQLLRKRWRIVVTCLLVAIALAAGVTWRQTPIYQAKTELFVAARTTTDLSGLAQGGQFTQQRVQSYADIINSPEVTNAVASKLNVGLSGKQIADEITASAPLNTVLVDVSVRDKSAARAQLIANTVSSQFATYAADLEMTPGSSASPVKVTVVKRAELPTSPVSPRKTLNLVLGFVVGLAVGVGAAVLRQTMDTTVKDPQQLQGDLDITTLGAIAFDRDAPKRPLIVSADPRSTRAEAFRQLRTNLQFINIDRPPRSIVITSSIPEEGKTTTATNLAIAIAQSGARVLLIEADLRRPKMADYLGVESSVGLTTVLIGRAAAEDVIQSWGGKSETLAVLPSGPIPPNPSELLGSQHMGDLLRTLEASYDLVIIDAPPLLPVTDAAVLARVADGALLVARYGYTKREQLARATEGLRAVDATILGVVLTMTPASGPDAYYYGYGYRYDRGGRHREKAELVTPVAATAMRRSDPVPQVQPESATANGGMAYVASPGATAPTAAPPSGSATDGNVLPKLRRGSRRTDDPLRFFRG